MTYAKEWPYYSKKNEQFHIVTLSYYTNKSIFFKADCVKSKHEKHSQDPQKNCRLRIIWICLGKYNSTYLTATFIHFDYKILKYAWTPRFSLAWKIKSMVFLTTLSSSCHWNMINYEKTLKKYLFTFSVWCKNRTNKDRRHIWYKISVDTIAVWYRGQTLY